MDFEKIVEEFRYFEKKNIEELVNDISNDIERFEFSALPHYDIPIYSFQRFGIKKGDLLDNPPKNKDNKFEYCFDKNNRIILIKEWSSFNNFDAQFFFYNENNGSLPFKSISYSYDGELSNITYYFYENSKIESSISVGQYGCRKEFYFYNSNGLLSTVKTQQFELNFKFINELTQEFTHDNNGILVEIKKIYDNDEDIIYNNK
ncbi:hypothetical protein [Neisseria animaloris]|uniref:hypothetical protein n=1 Tax=Neisseria animaloris TaxID=326522 RepID=UPI0039E06297